eukprot:TRINITY_DN34_c0_g1_i1.p1 TRINITY_DN34_c0_g1~~TRINITY_DN34_c0_g1_i1.p1  ORF type:complete len:505 (-),score=72.14 TRINITY_DN34_c0_g1_i1:43-1557(-)
MRTTSKPIGVPSRPVATMPPAGPGTNSRDVRPRRPSFSLPRVYPQTHATHSFSGYPNAVSSTSLSPLIVPSEEDISDIPSLILGSTLAAVQDGLARGFQPELIAEGTGGSYFLAGSNGKKAGVFKPNDEEPLAPNNPKGYHAPSSGESTPVSVGSFSQLSIPGMKPGVLVGEAAIREVAAYLLDHGHSAGVPATALIQMTHPFFSHASNPNSPTIAPVSARPPPAAGSPASSSASHAGSPPPIKVGSFQQFVEFDEDSGSIGPSLFPLEAVHRIAILDMRLMNADRHEGNIVVQYLSDEGVALHSRPRTVKPHNVKLVPIDHGFSLPDVPRVNDFEWVWFSWPQAKLPFSPETVEYIHQISIAQDTKILRTLGIRDSCIRVMRASTTLLKLGVAAGLSLYDIASLMCRLETETPSPLERLWEKATQRSADAPSPVLGDEAFFRCFSHEAKLLVRARAGGAEPEDASVSSSPGITEHRRLSAPAPIIHQLSSQARKASAPPPFQM